jgi:hypothetical protein
MARQSRQISFLRPELLIYGGMALLALLVAMVWILPRISRGFQAVATDSRQIGKETLRRESKRSMGGAEGKSTHPSFSRSEAKERLSGSMVLPEQWAESMGWEVDGEIPPGSQSGELVLARVTTSRGTRTLAPNQVGNFERLFVRPKEKIEVSLLFPQATEGDEVVVEVNDGGRLANGTIVEKVRLDSNRSASFSVWVTEAFGTHRLAIYRPEGMSVLDLWVGDHEIPSDFRTAKKPPIP